jgi:hypothetical protein
MAGSPKHKGRSARSASPGEEADSVRFSHTQQRCTISNK